MITENCSLYCVSFEISHAYRNRIVDCRLYFIRDRKKSFILISKDFDFELGTLNPYGICPSKWLRDHLWKMCATKWEKKRSKQTKRWKKTPTKSHTEREPFVRWTTTNCSQIFYFTIAFSRNRKIRPIANSVTFFNSSICEWNRWTIPSYSFLSFFICCSVIVSGNNRFGFSNKNPMYGRGGEANGR